MNNYIEVKIYGRGKGNLSAHTALTDYSFIGLTEKQAVNQALKNFRSKYTGMKPEIAEIGGVRRTPGAGRIMWAAKGVEIPKFS